MSHNASISFEIILSPEVIREYFNGLAKVEAAKNGILKPLTFNPAVYVENKPEEAELKTERSEENIEPELNSELSDDVEPKQEKYEDMFEDTQFKEMLTQIVNTIVEVQYDTQEEKHDMKRMLPNVIEVALSTAKSMQHTIKSDGEITTSSKPEPTIDDIKTSSNKEDAEMKDMLRQVVDGAINMQGDTQEEKDDMKRIMPNLIDIAMSMAESMQQTMSCGVAKEE